MTNHENAIVQRLDEYLDEIIAQKPLRQAVLRVEKADRSFCWTGAKTTLADAIVQPDSTFFIASIDKLFNATVAMKLVEKGLLNLDEPITAYLNKQLTAEIHRMDGVDYSPRITVRHLLSHASGLADWIEDFPKGRPSIAERLMSEGDFEMSVEESMEYVRTQLKPHFPPQDLNAASPRIRYSDTNFLLLIAIIEAITDQPLHEVHTQWLFRPLEMHHTYFASCTQPIASTPPPLTLTVNGEPLHIPRFIRSTYGIYSTTADLTQFLRCLIKGEVFENPATLDWMQWGWRRFGLPLDRGALRSPSWPIEYSLGMMRFCLPRLFTPFRPMPAVIGHSGSTGCWLFYAPKAEFFLAGSVEEVTAGALPYRLIPKMLSAL